MSRYRCVDAQKAAGFPVVAACTAAGVSASAFYAWTAKRVPGQPAAEQAEAELVAKIRTIHRESSGTYGSPRVTHELRRRGWRVNHKRVERLMAAHGIVGHRPRRRRGLTKADSATPPAPGRSHLSATARRSGWSARSAASTLTAMAPTAPHGSPSSCAGAAGPPTTSGWSG